MQRGTPPRGYTGGSSGWMPAAPRLRMKGRNSSILTSRQVEGDLLHVVDAVVGHPVDLQAVRGQAVLQAAGPVGPVGRRVVHRDHGPRHVQLLQELQVLVAGLVRHVRAELDARVGPPEPGDGAQDALPLRVCLVGHPVSVSSTSVGFRRSPGAPGCRPALGTSSPGEAQTQHLSGPAVNRRRRPTGPLELGGMVGGKGGGGTAPTGLAGPSRSRR